MDRHREVDDRLVGPTLDRVDRDVMRDTDDAGVLIDVDSIGEAIIVLQVQTENIDRVGSLCQSSRARLCSRSRDGRPLVAVHEASPTNDLDLQDIKVRRRHAIVLQRGTRRAVARRHRDRWEAHVEWQRCGSGDRVDQRVAAERREHRGPKRRLSSRSTRRLSSGVRSPAFRTVLPHAAECRR